MPVWNPHPDFLRKAVHSIIQQTWSDFELIVVEDPSSESAAPLLAEFDDSRIHHICNSSRTSLVDQLNQGLAEARAALIARHDADDVSAPDRLNRQVEFMYAHPEVAVCGSQLHVIDSEDRPLGYRFYPTHHSAIVAAMPLHNPIAHPSVMCRKETIVAAGGYLYRRYPALEDYDLWCRLARLGCRFANLPEALVLYRIHPSAMKSSRLHEIIRGTVDVKRCYWPRPPSIRAWLRRVAECMLLWLPSGLVLRLFLFVSLKKWIPRERKVHG
jgi:glycosyltransferase involved in cell wall biosynthesis